ncbi:MAG: hypothetical protein R3B51_12230 [Thermodesulfobacteriota bacterium]
MVHGKRRRLPREECRNDEVARVARELLSGTGFQGIGSIEFKLDD